MPVYNYIDENGTVTSRNTTFTWHSLCHNENIMENFHMLQLSGGFGWSICRLCGKPTYFTKKWFASKNKDVK